MSTIEIFQKAGGLRNKHPHLTAEKVLERPKQFFTVSVLGGCGFLDPILNSILVLCLAEVFRQVRGFISCNADAHRRDQLSSWRQMLRLWV